MHFIQIKFQRNNWNWPKSMSIIVKNGKFGNSSTELTNGVMDISSDTSIDQLLSRIGNVALLRIEFPTSVDGRGFSLAKSLRQHGYKGHLRAYGHLLADQYPLAIRCGFDDVEISSELANRQPEQQWTDTYMRTQNSYQEKLGVPVRA